MTGSIDPPTSASTRDIGLFSLASAVLRRWRLVLGLPLGLGVLTAAISFLLPPAFTATASFVPETSGGGGVPSVLSGLAGQLGVSFGSEGSQSPQFYAQVLMSPGIMNQVLQTRFPDPRPTARAGDSTALLVLLKVPGDSLADSLEAGRKMLTDLVSPHVNAVTSVVDLQVETRYPELSAEVANTFIRRLNAFNTNTRQSRAGARRRFIEERLAVANHELRAAEDSLQEFYERNRSWRDAPQLVVQEERLHRRVDSRRELQASLTSSYESARIEEVNDAPVITVVDWADPPTKKSKPQRKLMVLVAVAGGGLLALLIALASEYLSQIRREGTAEYEEFRSLARGVGSDVRRLLRGGSHRQ
jgi:uncharacterized protein involved in exopolysaccharide biosynthesis